MLGFAWGYANMLDFSKKRERRDAEAQNLAKARVQVLTGKLDADAYQRAVADAERSAQEYEAARTIAPLGRAQPRVPPRFRAASLSGRPAEQDDEEGVGCGVWDAEAADVSGEELLQDFRDHCRMLDEDDGSSSSR